jgi:uncharacterized protein YfiM (DUF2279 family)
MKHNLQRLAVSRHSLCTNPSAQETRSLSLRAIFVLIIAFFCVYWSVDTSQATERTSDDTTTVRLERQNADAWLDKDKADHLLASAFLTGAQYYALHRELERSHEQSLRIAIGGTLVIGLGKEIYDHVSRKGTPSMKDVVADVLGIAVAAVLLSR